MVLILRKIPAEQLRLIVFDLDGTLIDSRTDLAQSVNGMLRHFHRHELPEDVIASYIGDGVGMLVRRALGDPEDEALVDEAETYFLDYYREHKLDHTYVYDGCHAVLMALQTHPRKPMLALLSNKPVGPSRAICEALGVAGCMFRIYGGNSFPTKKPDPLGLETLIREAGVAPHETVMIGDSDVDILTAQNVGVYSIGCSYGLSPHTLEIAPPDVLIHKPADLFEVLAL
ncbi:MAG TPA: HAD hydrolase-like protein [Acidobacteriaceae bacterium]|nr:HAD hydrolase-like protein [Acidobacteriaceae bacterium]